MVVGRVLVTLEIGLILLAENRRGMVF